MAHKGSRVKEKELYEPIREYLIEVFEHYFGNCHLEVTANGVFSSQLKRVVRHDIIFSFLGRKASPDLTGFIHRGGNKRIIVDNPSSVQDYITVEIKSDKVTLQDIYQAKMYGDLFRAKYALLVSPKPIPEEIIRLDKQCSVTHRFMRGWVGYVGVWCTDVDEDVSMIEGWLPYSPFPD